MVPLTTDTTTATRTIVVKNDILMSTALDTEGKTPTKYYYQSTNYQPEDQVHHVPICNIDKRFKMYSSL